MYHKIKQLLLFLFPKRVLFKWEGMFRKVVYLYYKGDRYQCNICNKQLRKFVLLQNGDQLCPYCGSISRTRRLWSILNSGYLKNEITVLDFSPSRTLYRALKSNASIKYFSTDISGDFLSDFQYDITSIDSVNEKFDLIICYHILEHIENDTKAMSELYRVLKPGGIILIQTPFKKGDTYEDLTIKSEEERLKHFGQKDHVRIYSVKDLEKRLSGSGFKVEVKEFKDVPDNKFGWRTEEEVFVCSK